jgi:hypothetical protein
MNLWLYHPFARRTQMENMILLSPASLHKSKCHNIVTYVIIIPFNVNFLYLFTILLWLLLFFDIMT